MFTGGIPEVYGRVTGSVREGNRKVTGRLPESTGGLPEHTGGLPERYRRVTGRATYCWTTIIEYV